ncbi:uncharacterized protein [Ambystoma mexicanum]|uniref:uncharacterized protein n=1 Tax=Ambystoma mexicanum TaxID=8296 RepID=UPI0037E99A13
MSPYCESTQRGTKLRREVKLSAVKIAFLKSINLNELVLEIFNLLGFPIELELHHELEIAASSLVHVLEAEKALQELVCQRNYPIDINRFGIYEWLILKHWLNSIDKDSVKRVRADVCQDGDTGSFQVVVVGFKDVFGNTDAKILDFLNGLQWITEPFYVGSQEILLLKNVHGSIDLSPLQVNVEVVFDINGPPLLFHGPRKHIHMAKALVNEFLHLKAMSVDPVRTRQRNLVLSLVKHTSNDLLQQVDMLIYCSFVSTNSCPAEGETSKSNRESESPAISVSSRIDILPGGKCQRVITIRAFPLISPMSPQNSPKTFEACFREALYSTLTYSEKHKLSSLAIFSPPMKECFISETDYTRCVVKVFQRFSQDHQTSTYLEKVTILSDDDIVLDMLLSCCKEVESPFEPIERNSSPEVAAVKCIKVEIEESVKISQEKAPTFVLVPIDKDQMPVIDAQSILCSDGGVLDYICKMIPTMSELPHGNPVLLPVQPYTKLPFQFLVLLGFHVHDNIPEYTEKALENAARTCLEMSERFLWKVANIHIPDIAPWGMSTFHVKRTVSDVADHFEREHPSPMIKRILYHLQPSHIPSLIEKEMEKHIENLGMCMSEEPLFIKYLTECSSAREDICRKMKRFGGDVQVCLNSHSLLIIPTTTTRISELELLRWTESVQAALEAMKGEYLRAEEDQNLVELLNNEGDYLLCQFKSTRVFNQNIVIGLQLEVKGILHALKELAFQKEMVHVRWRIFNRASSFILLKCLHLDGVNRYKGLSVRLDDDLSTVLFKGPREAFLTAEKRCWEILNGLIIANVELTQNQLSFLKTVDIDQFNVEMFFSKGMLVGLNCKDGELMFIGVKTGDIINANSLLQSTIKEYHIKIPDPALVILYSEKAPNTIDLLKRVLAQEGTKPINILMFQDAIRPYEVAVVGRENEAIVAKTSLEQYLRLIEESVFSFKTPGAWQYLNGDGSTWLKKTATISSCVANVQPRQMISPILLGDFNESKRCPSNISLIKIHPVKGTRAADLTKMGVFVCPLAFDMDLNLNPFSQDVMALTGQTINCRQNCLPSKEVLAFSHSDLHDVTIYFVNFLQYNDLLGQAREIYRANVRCCLDKCQTSAIHNITFPIIGSGGFGFPLKEEIHWLLEEIMYFTQENDDIALEEILVSLPYEDSQATCVFEQEMWAIDGKLKPSVIGDIDWTCRSLDVYITGKLEDRNNLKEDIKRIVDDNTSKEVLSSHFLLELTDEELLIHLKDLRNQGILIRKGKELNILGVTKFVSTAIIRIKDLLSEKAMARLESDEMFRRVQWQYFYNTEYVSFDKKANLTIERAYQKKNKLLPLHLGGETLNINLDQGKGILEGDQGSTLIWLVRKEIEPGKKISSDNLFKNWQEQDIQNPLIANLQRVDEEKILGWGKSHRVLTTMDKAQSKIRLQGRKSDVMESMAEIQRLLMDLSQDLYKAIKSSSHVHWMYRMQGTFYTFDAITTCLLEKHYGKHVCNSGTNVSVNIAINGEMAEVDYSKMEAELEVTKKKKKLKRVDSSSGMDLPPEWEPMDGKLLKQVPLNPNSQEYIDVKNNFYTTVINEQIVKIERIQNSYLRKAYELRKQLFFQKNGGSEVNEMTLFHGTALKNSSSINTTGFNRSYECNGKAYGTGVYFALNASYSCSYAKPDPKTQLRGMYQAKVVTGRYTKGHSITKAPPARPGKNKDDFFDSVVDNCQYPSMFVVFHDDQAYPEYLITFK